MKRFIGENQFIENYFGVTIFAIIFLALIYIFSVLIKCKRRKMVFRIRLYFFILLLCSIGVLYFADKINLSYERVLASEEQIKTLVSIGVYQYRIGLFFTFLLGLLYSNVPGMYIYISLGICIFLSMFFLFAKPIRVSIQRIINNRREKKKLEIERKLLQEQIELKEFFEKQERERIQREKEEKELVEQIQKERLELEKIGEPSEEEILEDEESEEIEEEQELEELEKVEKVEETNEIEVVEEVLEETKIEVDTQEQEGSKI